EGLTKQYGVTLAIGERTAEMIAGTGMSRVELDLVRVKGRNKPSHLFTLAETLDVPEGRTAELLQVHEAFIAAYRSQQWDLAEEKMHAAEAIGAPGLEKLYHIYAERIAEYRAEPPGEDWDGAYTATEK
ncbi:MAG TPA: adenylate/guanylate cyclase domain-containing protein, partial [Alphaproteobacteria bacterium]|nr:adenylate/guanylate cyclase domain-containing protein [Alphaproteobacteria bacterium]